jgi:hypothetical protein
MAADILNCPRAVTMSVYVILKEDASVTVSGRRTELNMCPDLEQRHLGASRDASPLPTAATGLGKDTQEYHTEGSPAGSVNTEPTLARDRLAHLRRRSPAGPENIHDRYRFRR